MKLCFPASASARFAASLRSDAALGRTAAAQSVNSLQLRLYNLHAAGTGTALSQSVYLAQQNLVKAGGRINRNARKVEPLLNLLRARIPVALCFFAVTEPCFLAPAPSPALLRRGVAFAIFAVRYNV